MADLMTCPTCGALNQQIDKFCEQCGSRVEPASGSPDSPTPPDSTAGDAPPVDADPAPAAPPDDAPSPATADLAGLAVAAPTATGQTMRFIQVENGVLNRNHSFDVPVGATLLVGRTDPVNGVFPEVDVTMWSQRVRTPDGDLYTIHRRQCFISRDKDGRVRIRDCPEYLGDTLVSPVGTAQFRRIPEMADSRDSDAEGAVALEVGDRILMGQGEGMLIFQLMEVPT